ncbi:hypothetical protein GCM10010452_42890 [Crossiella cryophila]
MAEAGGAGEQDAHDFLPWTITLLTHLTRTLRILSSEINKEHGTNRTGPRGITLSWDCAKRDQQNVDQTRRGDPLNRPGGHRERAASTSLLRPARCPRPALEYFLLPIRGQVQAIE